LNPTKDSVDYWTSANRAMLNFDAAIRPMWEQEKLATLESIAAVKEEALVALAREREQVMRMSREEAIRYLILDRNIDGREKKIRAVSSNDILAIA
jgi:type II restriction enzyme